MKKKFDGYNLTLSNKIYLFLFGGIVEYKPALKLDKGYCLLHDINPLHKRIYWGYIDHYIFRHIRIMYWKCKIRKLLNGIKYKEEIKNEETNSDLGI